MYLCKRHFIKFCGIFIIPTGKQVECIEVHKTNYLIYSKLMYCIYKINAPFVSQFVYKYHFTSSQKKKRKKSLMYLTL